MIIPLTVTQEVVNFTKFDKKHCHEWAILLNERKIDGASAAVDSGDFETAKKLISEIFHGDSSVGKYADPGMERSLLHHMAMITKMAAEPRLVLEELVLRHIHAYRNHGAFINQKPLIR